MQRVNNSNDHRSLFYSLVPYREKSSDTGVTKRGPYSPFQVEMSNKVDFAFARVDDLVNWGRKVYISLTYSAGTQS